MRRIANLAVAASLAFGAIFAAMEPASAVPMVRPAVSENSNVLQVQYYSRFGY
jgi:hypothetical protein